MSKERIDLIVIDPQNDFCDPKGSLFVPGANEDMKRVASMIDRYGSKIKKIHVTLDCHHSFDIAHAKFWRNSGGDHPGPFTIITNQDVVDGNWFPVFMSLPNTPDAREYAKEYTKKLEEGGKYPLCIWPNHCLIGSWGNNVYPVLFEALSKWETENNNNVNYVSKGSNITTEHYSAIQAEIPDSHDPSTMINTALIDTWQQAARLLWAGEALSHCLKSTMLDAVLVSGGDDYLQKVTLLTDGTSSVISPFVDFPEISREFIKDMKIRGMQVAKTTDF